MKLLHSIPIALTCLVKLAQAGDGCNEGRHCVCYDDVGECYSEEKPWGGTPERPLKDLPLSPSQIDPEFRLYTTSNKNSYDLLVKDKSVPSHFKASKRTVFIAHGFLSDGNDDGWMGEMKDAILKHNDYNVILINWENGANVGVFNLDYPKASQNTRVVGDMLGQLIDYLHSAKSFSASNAHCIGHSLGAHVCGYGAKALKNAGKMSRISGMDPAGPYFEWTPTYVRLDKSDATFVDSIHTDGEPLYEAGFGMLEAISHADYYPNGGVDQPGCRNVALACSHGRSHQFYLASITNSCTMEGHVCGDYAAFLAGSCNSCGSGNKYCGEMGWHADKNTRTQSYYLETSDKSPYCK